MKVNLSEAGHLETRWEMQLINLKNSFSRIGATWPAGHSWCPRETGGCVSAVTRRIAAGMSSNLRLSVCLSLRLSISGGGLAAARLDQVDVPPIPWRCTVSPVPPPPPRLLKSPTSFPPALYTSYLGNVHNNFLSEAMVLPNLA